MEEQEVPVLDAGGNQVVIDEIPQTEVILVGTGEGTVTGINRGPIQGENYAEKSPQFFTEGHYPERYKFTGGEVVVKTPEELSATDDAKELEAFKAAEEVKIRNTYAVDSEAPVEVTIPEGSFTFNGGQDSASYISGAVTLAQSLGESTVFITDVDNIKRELSFDSANTVAVLVAKQYRDAFFTKQDALVALANLTTVEGE